MLKVNTPNEATCSTLGPQLSTYHKDLCEAFTCTDIPLYKLDHPKLRVFLETYMKQIILHESTLYKH